MINLLVIWKQVCLFMNIKLIINFAWISITEQVKFSFCQAPYLVLVVTNPVDKINNDPYE